MIIDFACRETSWFLNDIAPAIPGALIVLFVVSGLAFIGQFLTRSQTFNTSDIFVGWGAVAGIMTLASVFFDKPLLITAFGIFFLMIVGFLFGLRNRYFSAPFWILAIFPGLFVLVAINAIGLGGGFSYDDYSHWEPNALFVFLNDDVPSKALPSIHSIYPGYPYALPFLTYLASLLAGGFLVQGGAMINFLLFLSFAAFLVETTERTSKMQLVMLKSVGLTALALVFATFLGSAISTFGITNQGDTGTMVLCGAIGIMFWQLSEALCAKSKRTETKQLLLRLALMAVAFLLLKEANLVLLFILVFAYLVICWRNGVLKKAMRTLPILFPALILRVLWQYYANSQIGGGGVGIVSFSAWRFDLFIPLLHGIVREIMWKPEFFVLFLGTFGYGLFSLFRPQTPSRNLAIFAAIVQIGYAAFLIVAFLGSDFTEFTIKMAASFHRYMLHAAFLAFPVFWIAVYENRRSVKDIIKLPAFLTAQDLRIGTTIFVLILLPMIMFVQPDWIALRADSGTCHMRKLTQSAAASLPEGVKLGTVFPGDSGFMSFVVGFELALEEAQTGRSMVLDWHSDNFHTFTPPTKEDVSAQLKNHPETNALIFTPDGYELLKNLGFKDEVGSGFLVLEQGKWKARGLSR